MDRVDISCDDDYNLSYNAEEVDISYDDDYNISYSTEDDDCANPSEYKLKIGALDSFFSALYRYYLAKGVRGIIIRCV